MHFHDDESRGMILKSFLLGVIIIFIITPFSFSQTLKYKSADLQLRDFSNIHFHGYSNIHDSTKNSDSVKLKKTKTVETFHMKKSPWVALLLSGIFPGAGQFYNESYWKVPILVGLSVYFGYSWFDQNRQFLNYRDRYAASQTPQFPDGDLNLKTLREFYRNQRDDFTWYFIITYFVNLVDAYVDAQLFDFTVKEDKYTSSGKPGKIYKLNFHLNF